ncbi:MAG: hypothetical protein GC165_02420 [Armatimonadetes bacterium]|nr:hypothetical protein [Armatimonadota bacterium]
MQFYVVDESGQRYGPADFMTLNQWAQQGRILPHTVLEEVGTGRQTTAAQLQGLTIPNENAYRSPYQTSPNVYPRIVESQADKLAGWAKALGICGLLCCPIFSVIGIFVGIAAHTQGSTKARGPIILCVVTLLISILGFVLYQVAVQSLMNSM